MRSLLALEFQPVGDPNTASKLPSSARILHTSSPERGPDACQTLTVSAGHNPHTRRRSSRVPNMTKVVAVRLGSVMILSTCDVGSLRLGA